VVQCGQQNGHGVQIEGGSFHNIVANCTFVNIAPPAQMHAVVLGGERCTLHIIKSLMISW